MTAALADLREFTRWLSTFAAFERHFVSAFLAIFNGGFLCCSTALISLASWAANRALSLMRARAKGHSLQQIAKDLEIGYGTVRARLQSTLAGTYAKTALRENNF
jgi:hypothetical protein